MNWYVDSEQDPGLSIVCESQREAEYIIELLEIMDAAGVHAGLYSIDCDSEEAL